MSIKKLSEEEAFRVVGNFVKIPKQKFCESEEEVKNFASSLGFPVVLKAVGSKIVHKTEIGAVKIAYSSEELNNAIKKLFSIEGCEKILVQEFVKGIETILGVKKDETFGHIVLFGLGGIYTEIFKDVSLRVCPVTSEDAKEMLHELKAGKIFEGFRGIKVNKDEIINAIVGASKLAVEKNIVEMDINPLICNANGCFAVDVRIFLQE